ncbi:hypothetical protein [Gryllotalpicola protaetiae]|uniref:Uncharacterized protein n=1 Tax=Gryllotalpicola protaetiae TaxID=2419771 RepID=A0A387BQ70_9MICO|nr:hypothetical protein [Gryllotalpicola protaetiae]AYG04214.1 hypothetical protein D7I44_12180 [Gryllotalpicola protaetiae]
MSVYSCTRVVGASTVTYLLLLPAAHLLTAEPLVDAEVMPATGVRLEVTVERPLVFDPISLDERRGLVTIGDDARMAFEGLDASLIRHGMVAVRITAPLPATVWRLDAPLVDA